MKDVTDEIFGDIVDGLKQIEKHVGGEDAGIRFRVPDKLDVVAIRTRSGNSQPVFANSIGVKVATLKQWEQGRRSPQGPARVLLAMIDAEPNVVSRVLAKAARSGRKRIIKVASETPPVAHPPQASKARRGRRGAGVA